MVQVILLAAGLSKRFGKTNKLTHRIGETAMLVQTMKRLQQANLSKMILVTGHERETVLASLPDDILFNEVYNEHYEKGMTSSIQKAVQACDEQVSAFMICLGDQIHIQAETYRNLVEFYKANEASQKGLIVAPFYQDNKGNPVVFSNVYRKQVLGLAECNGCKQILRKYPDRIMKYSTEDEGILMDIDRIEDL